MEPFEIDFIGQIPCKKNNWGPKNGGIGITDPRVIDAIDRLALQVPGMYRDLNLEHCAMDFYFRYASAGWDRDGAYTTLLDILARTKRWGMHVIMDDNIRRCNGVHAIHEAVPSDVDGCRVVITPR